MICLNCEAECKNKYCNKTCRIRYRNRMWRRAHPKKLSCLKCGGQRNRGARNGICPNCMKQTTLADYHERISAKDKHGSWRNAAIRSHNRTWNKELGAMPCQVCGYSKHVELAHIKAVTDFSEGTPVGVVNAADNILVLCRNHHWEFDHGVLTLDQIPKRMDSTPGIKPGSSA